MVREVELVVVFDHMVGQIADRESERNVELIVLFALQVLNADFPLVFVLYSQFPEVLMNEEEVLELEGLDPDVYECKAVVEDAVVVGQRAEDVLRRSKHIGHTFADRQRH